MIYTCNQKGNIGYSSSKLSSISKKLFTPIQLSPPILSETIHDKENSLPNSPIQIRKKKKLREKDFDSENQNHSSKEVYNRSKSRQLKKSLQIFNENFDNLVNTIKNNRRNFTINSNQKIEKEKLIRAQTQFEKKKDNNKNELRNAKINIGTDMYKRFMKGFLPGKSEEDKENQTNTQFFFKKLHF